MFDKLFVQGTLPQTIFRKMYGFYYDGNYNRININDNKDLMTILSSCSCQRIVIKPAVDSCSGNGVKLFEQKNNIWYELGSGEELNIDYLNKKLILIR